MSALAIGLSLALAAASSVRGVVLDAETSAPQQGVTVKLSDGRQAVTDEGGAFSFDEVKPGAVKLEASAPGYDLASHPLTAPESGEVSLMVAIGKKVLPGDINGVALYRPATGPPLPIAGAVISIPGRPLLRSDKDGKFQVAKLGPGPVSLKVRAAGYKVADEIAVIPSGGVSELEVALVPTSDSLAILRGQVRSASGQPVKARLQIPQAKVSATTGDDGAFILRINAGRYKVTFEAEGFTSQTKQVEVAPGDQALFYIDLSPER